MAINLMKSAVFAAGLLGAVWATANPVTNGNVAAKPAAAGSTATATAAAKPIAAPKAGGSGGSVGGNSSTSGANPGPKKPKAPDPTKNIAETAVSK